MRSKPVPWAASADWSIPTRVAQREEAGHGLIEVLDRHLEVLRVARFDVGRPGAGEAVGLQLAPDRGIQGARPPLHGVGELVGEDDPEREGTELVVQARDEVDVVPGDQVRGGAVEGVAGDLVVGRHGVPARRLLRVRPVGPEAALDRFVRFAVEPLVGAAPERLDIVERVLDHLVARRSLVDGAVPGPAEGEPEVTVALRGTSRGEQRAGEQQADDDGGDAAQRGESSRGAAMPQQRPGRFRPWTRQEGRGRGRRSKVTRLPSKRMSCSPTVRPRTSGRSESTTVSSSSTSTPGSRRRASTTATSARGPGCRSARSSTSPTSITWTASPWWRYEPTS